MDCKKLEIGRGTKAPPKGSLRSRAQDFLFNFHHLARGKGRCAYSASCYDLPLGADAFSTYFAFCFPSPRFRQFLLACLW